MGPEGGGLPVAFPTGSKQAEREQEFIPFYLLFSAAR